MKKKMVYASVLVTGLTLALAGCGQGAAGKSSSNSSNSASGSGGSKGNSKYVIALSNSFYGNTWRHQMVSAFKTAADQAKQQGLISNYIVENGDNSVSQQISQMNDLILKHVNAIVIDAASPTALNGVIKKAENAGIKVIAFDSVVKNSPKTYKLSFSFKKLGSDVANYAAKRLNDKGNVLIVRGVAGSLPDKQMYDGNMSVIKQHPGLKVVGTVYGQASTSVTESKVSSLLPSLPKVDAVLCQGGGDDYGVLQAFQQANRKIPIITAGGDANFLHWWYQQHKKNGYSTYSENSTPGIGGAALWLATDILHGSKPPMSMTMPNAVVTDKNLQKFANMKQGHIVSPTYTNAWVKKNILSQK